MPEVLPAPPVHPLAARRGRGRGRAGLWLWVLAGLAVSMVLVLLFWHRPAGQFFYPRCSFHTLSGLWCPGCGGLRSMHELLHGHWIAAARCNALFVVGGPVAIAWWLRRRRSRPEAAIGPRTVWVGFAIVVAFTVLRNLPAVPFVWLAPVP